MHIEAQASDAGCIGDIKIRLAAGGAPFLTDSGNMILDCSFGHIDEPELLADALQIIPGVVEHGLFLGLADIAFIAGPRGVEVIEAEEEDDDGDEG